jgi:hypothetical protein
MSSRLDEVKASLGPLAEQLEELAVGSIIGGNNEDPRAPQGNSSGDATSIHFNYRNHEVEENVLYEYHDNVVRDLTRRQIPVSESMSPSERHAALKQRLVQEWTFRELKRCIDRGELLGQNQLSTYLLLDAVPCILHMENRNGLKIMTLLLDEGLKHCHKNPRYRSQFPNSRKQCCQAFVADVEAYINQTVLGTVERPAQWELPIEGNFESVGKICLDNNRTRLIVTELGGLIELSVYKETRRLAWREAILDNYCPAIAMVRRKEDFSQEDILAFQYKIDNWFQIWVKLHGKDGVTNYIHMLASGHISEYLKYWKSLYAHSQQGKCFNRYTQDT